MLTGKTIGELTLLETLTSNTLFPVELSGVTYHAAYSAFTINGGGVTEVTYDELYSLYTGGTLTSGRFYLMTDFQTCYDQPNYDSDSSPILFTSIPVQIIGTAGAISTASPAVGTTTNTFVFGIQNTTGSNVTVNYGYLKIS
jgi:hypothetical protein